MEAYKWSKEYVLDELDGAEGWVWFNWAIANESSVWGMGSKIKGLGYIGMEREKLKAAKRKV